MDGSNDTVDGSDDRALRFKQAVQAGRVDALRGLFDDHPALRQVIDAPWFSFGKPAIVEAASRTDRDLVDALLELGADIDARSDWDAGPYSALHSLVDGPTPERLAFADYLAERGATIDLHAAAGMGRMERIEEILDAEPDRVSEPGPDGATPLHLARNPAVAALLLERGAEIDKRCIDHRSTAAMWATQGREDVMRYLLEQGASPDLYQAVLLDDVALASKILEAEPEAIHVRVKFGESHEHLGFGDKYVWALGGADTPTELARQRGKAATYAFLLSRSPPALQLLQASRRADEPALESILAAHPDLLTRLTDAQVCEVLSGSATGAAVLLRHGADPDARDDGSGATALHHAAWRGLADLARALLAHRADASLRDRDYDATPLGWANENGQSEMMELLLSHQPPDLVDAAWLGDVDRVRQLLDEDPRSVDGLGGGRVSPLRGAAWCGHEEVVRTLLEYGANPSIPRPQTGHTAHDLAKERGHHRIVELLTPRS